MIANGILCAILIGVVALLVYKLWKKETDFFESSARRITSIRDDAYVLGAAVERKFWVKYLKENNIDLPRERADHKEFIDIGIDVDLERSISEKAFFPRIYRGDASNN